MKRRGSVDVDQGWAWVIGIASCVICTFTVGVTCSFGVLYVALLDKFEATNFVTSFIGSIVFGMTMISGLFAPGFEIMLGPRYTVMLGGGIAASGMFISIFVKNIYLLLLTYGFIIGLGDGLAFMTSMSVVNKHFNKHIGFAYGLLLSGTGSGMMIFSYLNELLLENFGLSGTFLLVGGVKLNVIVCGALYRDFPTPPVTVVDTESTQTKTPLMDEDKSEYSSKKTLVVGLLANTRGSFDEDINENDEVLNNYRITNDLSFALRYSSLINIPVDTESDQKSQSNTTTPWIIRLFKASFQRDILTNCRFWICTVCWCFTVMSFTIPLGHQVKRMQEYGVSSRVLASLSMTVSGGLQFICRLIVGKLADQPFVNPHVWFVTAEFLFGTVNLISVWLYSFWGQIAYMCVFGITMATFISYYPLLLRRAVGSNNFTPANSVLSMCTFPWFMVAGPFAGYLRDITGSYEVPFIMSTVSITLSASVMLLLPVAERFSQSKLKKVSSNSSTHTYNGRHILSQIDT